MRRPRLKRPQEPTIYHFMSKTAGSLFLFGPEEKDQFERLMQRYLDFCGFERRTHTVMSNHFHIVALAPGLNSWSDAAAMQRARNFYSANHPYLQDLEDNFKDGQLTNKARKKLQARMEVSGFMKELKQTFTNYYNAKHGREGTLWSARFTSVIAENSLDVMRRLCGYVDLNPTRGRITPNPEDYQWSGYGQAMRGNLAAQEGLRKAMFAETWEETAKQYRMTLYLKGGAPAGSDKAVIDPEEVERVLREGGEVDEAMILRMRLRHFTKGGVIGSPEFVEQVFRENRQHFGPKRKTGPRKLRGVPLKGLTALRDLRKDVITPPKK